MKNIILLIRGVLSCLALSTAIAAPALRAVPNADPSAMLQAAVGEILEIAYPESGPQEAESLAAKMRPILDRTMDFDSITRRAFGPAWRQFSDTEYKRAVELFTALIVRTYAARFTDGNRPKIEYKPSIAIATERWEVRTRVSRDGSSYEIIYRIEKRSDGWRIYDIMAEGVSFVANYRAQFDAVSQKGGAAAILRVLETKQAAASGR